MTKLIVHVAEINISEESGMGRIAWHWRNELVIRGYEFIHIGLNEVGRIPHRGLFPYFAYRFYKKLKRNAAFFLIHEPAALPFVYTNIPTIIFSHGIEQRAWELSLQYKSSEYQNISWKTKLFYPVWRLKPCNEGLKKAKLLLLSNQEDAAFSAQRYSRLEKDIYIFKNGVYSAEINEDVQSDNELNVLFLGTWLLRKGSKTLIEAAEILFKKGLKPKWLLAGTGAESNTIIEAWPSELRPFVEVLPYFPQASESSIFSRSHIFVLPSFFEGQPLALLQAMEAERCCITTNCCGQRDIIQHTINGLLFEPGDATQLAELIEQCLRNRKLRLRLGENASLTVKNRQWERVSTELVDWLEKSV